jgi:hypothetical protein
LTAIAADHALAAVGGTDEATIRRRNVAAMDPLGQALVEAGVIARIALALYRRAIGDAGAVP